MKSKNKYYTPDITEFHIGFEYEVFDEENKVWSNKIFPEDFICTGTTVEPDLVELFYSGLKDTRVKYLDKEDIESLGFNDATSYKLDAHIKPKYSFFKVVGDDTLYTVQVYWHMLQNERENLIRVFKGKIHNYPYEEIFRGDIKNKSELKRLLKQLKI